MATSTSTITEDEAALYDRQLRLWGVEAQNRMRNASIVVAGRFKGLAAEVAKNIVLAGIGKLALVDDESIEWRDLGSNYWAREEDVGTNRVECSAPRLQLLNPRVEISTHTDKDLLLNEEFLATFDLVVLMDVDAGWILKMNELTRKLGKKFFAASSVGIHGWVFADLLSHDFVIDQQKTVAPGETITVPTKVSHEYVSFEEALRHDFSSKGEKKFRNKTRRKREALWCVLALFEIQRSRDSTTTTTTTKEGDEVTFETLRTTADVVLPRMGVAKEDLSDEVIERFVAQLGHEFAPTCAIVGGVLGQDVLNAVGGKEEPVRNVMVFDGELGEAGVWALVNGSKAGSGSETARRPE
ncbi:hypothetical protein JCM10212_005286 [Sporobolomyces blumeae]